MKKIIVNGVLATFICFALSSFAANTNNIGGSTSNTPFQDTTHKKMGKKKWDKSKASGDTTKAKKMQKGKKPA